MGVVHHADPVSDAVRVSAEVESLHRAIKSRFDPTGRLNPGDVDHADYDEPFTYPEGSNDPKAQHHVSECYVPSMIYGLFEFSRGLSLIAFLFFVARFFFLLGTFLAFAATMGLSMGSIGFVFKVGSIVQALFATTAAFAALSLYGYTTKRSLSGIGSFLVMGLFGLMIASLINIFVGSGVMSFVISLLGVVIFAGLTAWDTQRLKEEYDLVAGTEMAGKASIMGALTLYLNFINMFQFILSLLGQRED